MKVYVNDVPYNCSEAGKEVRREQEQWRGRKRADEKRGEGERKEERKGKGEEGRKATLSVTFLLQVVIDVAMATGRQYQGSILCPAICEICHVGPPNSA